MANAAEIASLITQGIRPPSGTQDVSFHTGVIKTWDPTSGVNSVEVNGVILSNLDSQQNGMGVSYLPGDVVTVRRVQTKYTIEGRASAPNGLTGSSPVALTGSSSPQNLVGLTQNTWLPLPATPTVQVRIGNAALVMFGVSRITLENAYVGIGLRMTGPANAGPGDFNGLDTAVGMNNGGSAGSILDFSAHKQLMFYRGSTWTSGGVAQAFAPGVYTFTLNFLLTQFSTNTAITFAQTYSPWISVIPF